MVSPVDSRPSTAEAPPIGKINQFSKIAITLEQVREGFKKKLQIIHILWINVFSPPPPLLITSAKVNNIYTKDFFIHIR